MKQIQQTCPLLLDIVGPNCAEAAGSVGHVADVELVEEGLPAAGRQFAVEWNAGDNIVAAPEVADDGSAVVVEHRLPDCSTAGLGPVLLGGVARMRVAGIGQAVDAGQFDNMAVVAADRLAVAADRLAVAADRLAVAADRLAEVAGKHSPNIADVAAVDAWRPTVACPVAPHRESP
jgi:hypothetical protein